MHRLVSASVVVLLAAGDLAAQEPSRVLNGYEFLPSRIVEDPFAITYFGTTTGGGVAFDLNTPFLDFEGDTLGTLTGNVAFMALGFRYQQRFGRWFAARLSFGANGRLGVDEQSVLAQGVTGSFLWSLGATARILQSDKLIVSGALDLSRTDLVTLDPFGFARKIIDEGLEAEDNSLVQKGDAISGVVGARVGWAPLPWLGVMGIVEGGRGDVTEASSQTLLGGSAAVGIDLKNLGVIPIGFQVFGETDAFQQGGADLATRSWTYGLGVFYTGWRDFSIGFEAATALLDRRDVEDDFEAFIATFNLRYWP
ncbi:MAG: hypothetical protein JSU87_17360 [Gemmatimonadota bacterium]|nr:MAG: hypothetical protein JSU87_17360 [Gemmatimonadota bacterium]